MKALSSVAGFFMMLILWGFSMVLLIQGCSGGPETGYLPPNLSASDIRLVVEELPGAPAQPQPVSGNMPADGTALGYLFEGQAGQVYDLVLLRTSGNDIPALSLYRFGADGWGEAIAWATADAGEISIRGWTVPSDADYLALVDVVAGDRSGTFELTVSCTSGCESDPGCRSDLDCPAGMACVDGVCVESQPFCRTDAECPAGMVCLEGACVESQPYCRSDYDCPAGMVCLEGLCVVPEGPGGPGDLCSTALGCQAGLTCLLFDEAHGYCAGTCDCSAGGGCEAPAECMWTDDVSCWCGYACAQTSDCPGAGAGWTCFDIGTAMGQDPYFTCIPIEGLEQPEGCTSDADCPEGLTCLDGACVDTQVYCRTDADCPAGMLCAEGLCVVPEGPGAAGDLCAPALGCQAGLECLLFDETHGYCAGTCDCSAGSGCEAPAECMWTDGQSCWCGYACAVTSDCPGGGTGWTCFDIGSAMGEEPFFTCIPIEGFEVTDPCSTDGDCDGRTDP